MRYIDDLRDSLDELLIDPKVVLIGEDIGKAYGGAFKVTKGLEEKYPQRVIPTPMSESALTGICVGMSLNGYKPILEIMFGDFITLCCDQIINHASKFMFLFEKDLNMVVRTPMGGYRGYGATHSQSIEKLFFGHSNIFVFAPNVLNGPGRLLKKAINFKNPVIFIENKTDYAKDIGYINERFDYTYDEPNEITTVNIKGEKTCDGYILTYGGMVDTALEVMWEVYMKEEKVLRMIVFNIISPLSREFLTLIENNKEIYTLEEGIAINGFGAEISRNLLENNVKTKKFRTFGAKNNVIGASAPLERFVLPDKDRIIMEIVGDINA